MWAGYLEDISVIYEGDSSTWGKPIFNHFPQCRAPRQMCRRVTHYREVRWTFLDLRRSVIISPICDTSWLTGTGGGRRWGTESWRDRNKHDWYKISFKVFNFADSNFLMWLQRLLFTVWVGPKCCGFLLMGCFTPCWPGTQWVAIGISMSSISRSAKLCNLRTKHSPSSLLSLYGTKCASVPSKENSTSPFY